MYKENAYSQNIQNNFFNKPIPEIMEVFLNQLKGRKVKIFMSFPDSIEWRDKTLYGILKGAGTNYVLITENNKLTLLPKIYINFIEFDENIHC